MSNIILVESACNLKYLRLPVLLAMVVISGQAAGQNATRSNYFFKSFRIASGFGYNYEPEGDFDKFHQLTWSNQFSVSITKNIFVGAQVYSVYTSGTRVPNENYFLRGAFVHYTSMPAPKLIGFLELNYFRGDYCLCGPAEPYRFPNLQYFGGGVGLEYPILNSNLYANFTFHVHAIFGDAEDKTGFNIYRIGLSYRFGKRLPEKTSPGIPISRPKA